MDTLAILIRAINTPESTPRARNGIPWYDRPVSPDWMLLLGFVVCVYGYIKDDYRFIFGGFLFFMTGMVAIMAEKGRGADTGSEGNSDEPVGPP